MDKKGYNPRKGEKAKGEDKNLSKWCAVIAGHGALSFQEKRGKILFHTEIQTPVCLPGEGGSQLVGVPDLAVDHGVEDRQQKEGEEVEEDQVEPVDVDL